MATKQHLPKVSIIILNYNSKDVTLQCLNSLKKIIYKNTEVILVDNGSTDNSVKSVHDNFPSVKVIRNKSNLGYADGNNIGFRKATGEFILFLNNDTVVEKNFLNILIAELKDDKKNGAVQPRIMQYPGKDVIDSVGSYFMYSGFLYHLGHNKKDRKKYHKKAEIFSMKGACMLFRKSVLDKVGVFDKDYFAYFEESDLCQRLLLSGFKILYIPESVIYHIGGETSKKIDNAFITYHSYKNRIYTYVKNFQFLTLLKLLPLHIALCNVASFFYLCTFKISPAYAIQKAILWNIFNFDRIIKQRKKISLIRKLSDGEYLPAVTRKVRLSYYYHLFTTALAGYED